MAATGASGVRLARRLEDASPTSSLLAGPLGYRADGRFGIFLHRQVPRHAQGRVCRPERNEGAHLNPTEFVAVAASSCGFLTYLPAALRRDDCRATGAGLIGTLAGALTLRWLPLTMGGQSEMIAGA